MMITIMIMLWVLWPAAADNDNDIDNDNEDDNNGVGVDDDITDGWQRFLGK